MADKLDVPAVTKMTGRGRQSQGEKLWAINLDDLSLYFITEHHLCQQSVYHPALVYFQLTLDRHFSIFPVLQTGLQST